MNSRTCNVCKTTETPERKYQGWLRMNVKAECCASKADIEIDVCPTCRTKLNLGSQSDFGSCLEKEISRALTLRINPKGDSNADRA